MAFESLNENHRRVAVLHSGETTDVSIVKNLEKFLESIHGPRLEYHGAIPTGQKEAIISRNLKKYAQQNLPLIVIVSEDFFHAVWPTSSKPVILQNILKYYNKMCLHIWADSVNLRTIRRYSTQMTTPQPCFRTVLYDKLLFMTHEEAGNELITLLHSKTFDERKMKINYMAEGSAPVERSTDAQLTPGTLPSTNRSSNQRLVRQNSKRSGSQDSRTSAQQMMELFANAELGEGAMNGALGPSTSENNPRKKKKKKKAGPSDDELLLADLGMKAAYEMAQYLDGYDVLGNDYKGLAAKFGFSTSDIGRFGMAVHRGEKPTVQLIMSLNNRQPELKVKEFEKVLTEMKRMDVVKYIKENIYRNR